MYCPDPGMSQRGAPLAYRLPDPFVLFQYVFNEACCILHFALEIITKG